MKKIFLTCVAMMVFISPTHAKDWEVDRAQSKLGFVGNQNGEKFSGGFKNFTAQISFDPDHPETGKIVATIDIASAYAGSADRDSMLPQKDWFDSSKFPQAQFASTSIRQTGPGQYEAAATLSIKGVTKNVTLPFTLTPEGDHWHAEGKVTLMRNEFNLGTGMFVGETYVKNAVDVIVDLVAKPQ